MRWEWVNRDRGVVTVPKDQSKSGLAYAVALNGVARKILERRHGLSKGESLVFPNPTRGRGGIVPYESARQAIMKAIKRAGIPHGTPHDLRHSYGRALERAGVPMAIIQAQLGHSSLSVTERYVSAVEDEARRYVEGFGLGGEAER
jgi:integrase